MYGRHIISTVAKFRQHLQTFGNAFNLKESSLSSGHLSCRRVMFSQDTRFTIRWRRQISESDHRLVQAGLKTTDLDVCEIHFIQYITDYKEKYINTLKMCLNLLCVSIPSIPEIKRNSPIKSV